MLTKEKRQRKSIRLRSRFFVKCRLFSPDGKKALSDWIEGYTDNISRGGLCLSLDNLNPAYAGLLKEKEAKLTLLIKVPVSRKPVPAFVKVNWMQTDLSRPDKYLLGLSYERISRWQNLKITYYARIKRLFLPFVTGVILLLLLAFIIRVAANR